MSSGLGASCSQGPDVVIYEYRAFLNVILELASDKDFGPGQTLQLRTIRMHSKYSVLHWCEGVVDYSTV